MEKIKTQDPHTSFKLSKLIKKAGFTADSEKSWRVYDMGGKIYNELWRDTEGCIIKYDHANYLSAQPKEYIKSYDIMNDICVVHAKEFFGDGVFDDKYEEVKCGILSRVKNHTEQILYLMQEGKKQECEEYIWNNCVFNPKNKEEK